LCAGIGYKVALCTVEQALEADGLTRLRDEATRADIAIDVSAGPIEARRGIVAALDSNLSDGALLLASVLSTTTTQAGSWGAHPERIAGFAALPPFEKDHPVELAAGLRTNTAALDRACAFFESLGAKTAIVKDSVGLVLPRLVCGLVNEAATALAEGVADASDIDLAMRLGTNYPHGPLEWGDAIGLDVVLSVLRGLQDEFGDDRYRPAPLIKQYVRAGWLGQKTSRGFYQYTAH
jgi:3-hydroxybutyryl-CoA dehydrogenase